MVYVLKFDRPLGDPERPHCSARYYVGYCRDGHLYERLALHRAGRGAAITAAARAAGIGWRVLVVIPHASRHEERRIKRAGRYERLDPARRRTPYVPRFTEAPADRPARCYVLRTEAAPVRQVPLDHPNPLPF